MRPLTLADVFDTKVLSSPQVAPDGQRVAFVVGDMYKDGTPSPKSQIWIVNSDGTDCRPFSTGPRTDHSPRWSPDGEWLAFLSDRMNEDGKDELFLLSRQGGEARRLFEAKSGVGGEARAHPFAWSPDGRQIAFLMSDPETDEEKKAKEQKNDPILFEHDHKFMRVWLAEVATGETRCVTTEAMQVWGFGWSPDGKQFALIVSDEPYEWSWYHAKLATAAAGGGSIRVIYDPAPRQITLPRWSPDGSHISFLQSVWSDRGVVSGDLHLIPSKGWEIDGYLLLPEGYSEGKRVPLFTWVHGGPTSLFTPRYWNSMPFGYYASKGFAVFLPNPRGSTGRGLTFAEANVGDMGGQDFADIMAGIERLIESGVADPDRLAIGGWSYGGYTTAWAVTQTDRFKCAVMGAGICNWLSFHGVSKLCEWDRVHYNVNPYELHATFERFSPLTHITNVRTPTLIIHGEKDWDVPPSQGYEFFRALKQHGVPTELRVYPREEHGFEERAHQRDWVEYAIGWLERWLV